MAKMNKQAAAKVFAIAVFIILIAILSAGATAINRSEKKTSPCAGRQWENPGDRLDCKYPYPPQGRWKAVYTKDFSESHNLPPENISSDLSPGIDYMEMNVLSRGDNHTVCLVSMLAKKPHDIALYPSGNELPGLPKDRRLTNFIDLDEYKDRLKATGSFSTVSRDYLIRRKGYQRSTFAMYAEDVLPGYDYMAADAICRQISMHPQYFPDGYAFWINKASVWGRYEMLHRNYDAPKTPKGQNFYDSHFFINIPYELVSTIFKDVPIGGQ